MATSEVILPSEIINDILSRLPSKPLHRFKCVSKQWYSLINSPFFIKLHLTQTLISDNSPSLIITQFSISSAAISDEQNPIFKLTELDHPLKHLCQTQDFSHYDTKISPQILGSCNGVVCISLYDKSSIFLYNPSTKTQRLIPSFIPFTNTNPHLVITPGHKYVNLVVFGFGYDTVSEDYKVVRMIETRKSNALVYRESSVYSLRSDSWKCVIDQTMKMQFVLQNSMGVLVNECLHFIVVGSEYKPMVKCYNIKTETFSFVELPKYDENFSRKSYVMRELGGYFSVLVNYQNDDVGKMYDRVLVRADLWVMKEYGNQESWFRLFSIRDPSRLGDFTHIRPIVYSKDRRRVLLDLDGLSFGWYDWGSKRFERVRVHGWPSAYAPCETWTFLDTLVSLAKEKKKEKSKAKFVPKENKNKIDMDGFLSSGFKLRL